MPRVRSARKRVSKPGMDYVVSTVYLTPELDAALDDEARRLGLNRSATLRMALASWVGDSNTPQRAPSESP